MSQTIPTPPSPPPLPFPDPRHKACHSTTAPPPDARHPALAVAPSPYCLFSAPPEWGPWAPRTPAVTVSVTDAHAHLAVSSLTPLPPLSERPFYPEADFLPRLSYEPASTRPAHRDSCSCCSDDPHVPPNKRRRLEHVHSCSAESESDNPSCLRSQPFQLTEDTLRLAWEAKRAEDHRLASLASYHEAYLRAESLRMEIECRQYDFRYGRPPPGPRPRPPRPPVRTYSAESSASAASASSDKTLSEASLPSPTSPPPPYECEYDLLHDVPSSHKPPSTSTTFGSEEEDGRVRIKEEEEEETVGFAADVSVVKTEGSTHRLTITVAQAERGRKRARRERRCGSSSPPPAAPTPARELAPQRRRQLSLASSSLSSSSRSSYASANDGNGEAKKRACREEVMRRLREMVIKRRALRLVAEEKGKGKEETEKGRSERGGGKGRGRGRGRGKERDETRTGSNAAPAGDGRRPASTSRPHSSPSAFSPSPPSTSSGIQAILNAAAVVDGGHA